MSRKGIDSGNFVELTMACDSGKARLVARCQKRLELIIRRLFGDKTRPLSDDRYRAARAGGVEPGF